MLNEILVAAVIVFVCLLLHVAGVLLMAEWLLQRRDLLCGISTAFIFAVMSAMFQMRYNSRTL